MWSSLFCSLLKLYAGSILRRRVVFRFRSRLAPNQWCQTKVPVHYLLLMADRKRGLSNFTKIRIRPNGQLRHLNGAYFQCPKILSGSKEKLRPGGEWIKPISSIFAWLSGNVWLFFLEFSSSSIVCQLNFPAACRIISFFSLLISIFFNIKGAVTLDLFPVKCFPWRAVRFLKARCVHVNLVLFDFSNQSC